MSFNPKKIKALFEIVKSAFEEAKSVMTDKGILYFAEDLQIGTIVFSAPGILAIEGTYVYTDANTQLPMAMTVVDGVVTAINAIDPVKVAEDAIKPLEQAGDATSNSISNDGQPGSQDNPIVPAGFAEVPAEETAANTDPEAAPENEPEDDKINERIADLESKVESLTETVTDLSNKVAALVSIAEEEVNPDSFKGAKSGVDYAKYSAMAERYRNSKRK